MTDTKKYPFDVDAISKGDAITVSELEHITGKRYGTDRYDLAVLSLREKLMDALSDAGKPATVCIRKGSLVVLTDADASEYNAKAQKQSIRSLFRAQSRNIDVDENNLNDSEKQNHERRLIIGGYYVQAIQKARRSIPSLTHQRSTPKIK